MVGARLRPLLVLVLLSVTAMRAWPTLRLLPTDTDCSLWLLRSRPSNAHVLHWVFGDAHFAGYRPVAAFTYWAQWVLGADPTRMLSFRWLDLALHLLAVVLVPWLFRVLHPGSPPWGGFLAGVLFAFHPSWQDIVPWLSRRSYGLCVVLGMLAAGTGVSAIRNGRMPIAGSLFLLASLLSNELGYVVAGVLALEALRVGRVRALAPVGASLGIAILAKALIAGSVGGYEKHVRSLHRAGDIVRESIEYLCFLPSHPTDAARVGAAAVALILAWIGRRSLATWWLLATLALYVLSNEWFYRMAYPAAVPICLLLAYATTRGALAALPVAVAVFGIAWRSPLLWDIDPQQEKLRQRRHEELVAMADALSTLPKASTVYVVPAWSRPRDANPLWNNSVVWGLRYVANVEELLRPDLTVRNFAFLMRPTAPRIEGDAVVFPSELGVHLWPLRGSKLRRESAEWSVSFDELEGPTDRTWLYFVPPVAGGLVRVR